MGVQRNWKQLFLIVAYSAFIGDWSEVTFIYSYSLWEIPARKKFGLIKDTQEKISDPQNTYDKKFLDPQNTHKETFKTNNIPTKN